MKEKKLARFFCESCDTEVVGDSKFCPKCGRFFASVRCPACELTGEHFLFEQGCPACGYAMDGSPLSMGTSQELRRAFLKEKSAKSKKKSLHRNTSPTKKHDHDPLPAWVYIICIILLGVVLIFLFNFLR